MWFHFLTISTVILQLINFWLLSLGKIRMSYYFYLVIYLELIIVELTLALNHAAEQWSVALYVIVDVWAVVMAVKGLHRLRTQAGECGSQSNKVCKSCGASGQ